MATKRLPLLSFLLVAAFALAGGRPAVAEGPAKFDAALEAHLVSLAPLRGEGARDALFDGRPILVKFFASW